MPKTEHSRAALAKKKYKKPQHSGFRFLIKKKSVHKYLSVFKCHTEQLVFI